MEESKSQKYDIVGVGICCVDHISLLERYPEPDKKIEALKSSVQGGGPVPTAICTASRLGAKTAFVGLVGDDRDGEFIKSELVSFGADASYLIARGGCVTSSASIWADVTHGTRNVVLDRKRTGRLTATDMSEHLFRRTKLVHLDGRDIEANIRAAGIVKESGGVVSLDVGSIRESVEELLPYVDHLVVSSAFAFEHCGSEDPRHCVGILAKRDFKSCVVTCGTDGAYGTAEGDNVIHQAAFHPDKIVDTTGAGDVYHGAYLFGLIRGWDLRKRMEFASAAAALKCREVGGRKGIPTLEETEMLSRDGK
jgi:ribokinase